MVFINMHSMQVGFSLNLLTVLISPQYHVVFDDMFYNVVSSDYHIWETPGNCNVLTRAMLIYNYVQRIGEFLLPTIFCITYKTIKKMSSR